MSDLAPSGDGGQVTDTPAEGQVTDTQPTTDGQAPGTDGLTDNPSTDGESFTNVNPAELPDELKPVYNSMLKDYRAKTAEIATLRQQSEALNGLISNPKFNQVMETLSRTDSPSPSTLSPSETDISQLTGDELLDKIIENPNSLTDLIEAKARQLIDPIAQRVYDTEASKQIEAMRGKYPDFQEHEPKIAETIEKYPDMPLEEAYRLVTYDKAVQMGINKAKEVEAKRTKAAQPGVSNTNVEPADKRMSIRESWEAAKRTTGWAGK